jgi:hypothetical protein
MVAKTFLRLDFIKKSILVRLTSRIFFQFEDGSVVQVVAAMAAHYSADAYPVS